MDQAGGALNRWQGWGPKERCPYQGFRQQRIIDGNLWQCHISLEICMYCVISLELSSVVMHNTFWTWLHGKLFQIIVSAIGLNTQTILIPALYLKQSHRWWGWGLSPPPGSRVVFMALFILEYDLIAKLLWTNESPVYLFSHAIYAKLLARSIYLNRYENLHTEAILLLCTSFC